MRFLETALPGAYLIEPVPLADQRGSLMRMFCARAFADQGLETSFVQHSLSYSALRGTIRGMHFQLEPHQEVKLVRCIAGAIYDVILDLRPASPTFGRWQGFELTARTKRQLYIPERFAHGFQTLCDDAEVHYLISAFHVPAAASGLRHDDPLFGIEWPAPPAALSDRDRSWPDYVPAS